MVRGRSTIFVAPQTPCGSGLAREGAGTFKIIIACHTAFASRLAPTVIRGKFTIFVAPQIPCGSGLAREGVGTFNIIIACHTAFASRLAPTMVRGRSAILVATQIFVGASLLAKASAHSTSSSPVTPISRASSLPQWSGARPQSSAHSKSLWERTSPRRRRHIQHHHRLSHRFREQARSHNGPGQGHNLQPNPNLCGSGLAREGVGTFNIIIACHTAFASRLAPTMVRGKATIFSATKIPAREGAGTVNIIIA